MNKEIKVALWEKKSQKGNIYYNGKFKLENKEYKITLFKNEQKLNEKAPDFNLIIRDSINTQEEQKNDNKGQINMKLGQDKVDLDQVYADFGNQLEYSEDDFPF